MTKNTRMREEMDKKLETISKESRSKKRLSTTINPRSETVENKIHNHRDPGL